MANCQFSKAPTFSKGLPLPANCLQTLETQKSKGALGPFLSPVRPGVSPEYRQQDGELKLDGTPGLSNFVLGFVLLCLPDLGRASGGSGWPQTQFVTRAGLTNL